MAFNFPSAPVLDQEFVDPSGVTYVWNGYGWAAKGEASAPPPTGDFVLKTGDTMSGDLDIVTAAEPTLRLMKGAAGNRAQVVGGLGGAARWAVQLGGGEAESTGNAGSDFSVERYDDAGVGLGSALIIDRASGETTMRSLTTNGRVYSKTDTGNIGSAIASLSNGSASLTLEKSASGFNALLIGNSGGIGRWAINLANGDAESSGNAGSNFAVERFDDTGAALGHVLGINRASGLTTFNGGTWVNGTATFVGEIITNGTRIAVGNTAGNAKLELNSDFEPEVIWQRGGVAQGWIAHNGSSFNFYSDTARTVGMCMLPGQSAWTSMSDARFPHKATATPVANILDRLAGVQLYENVGPSGQNELFFKAQELALSLPELVAEPTGPQTRDDSYVPTGLGDPNVWGVMYDRSGAVALQAIKELMAEVVNLRARLDAIERLNPTR